MNVPPFDAKQEANKQDAGKIMLKGCSQKKLNKLMVAEDVLDRNTMNREALTMAEEPGELIHRVITSKS